MAVPHDSAPQPTAQPAKPLAVEPQASTSVAEAPLQDAPSPEVIAIYLRPGKTAAAAQPASDETLVDSITRIVSEMLQQHLHESVTAAVRALAPRLVISFPDKLDPTDVPAGSTADPTSAADR